MSEVQTESADQVNVSVVTQYGENTAGEAEDSEYEPTIRKASEQEQDEAEVEDDIGTSVLLEKDHIVNRLCIAAKEGHIRTVLLLLQDGAEVDAKDVIGKSALQYAAESGHTEVVRLQLKNNVVPRSTENHNSRLLDYSNVIADDPDDPAQISDAESINSVLTGVSSLSSRSSLYSCQDIQTASKELIWLFLSDKALACAFNEVFEDGKISATRFERNLRRLLKQFSIELGKEAQESSERVAARFTGNHAREIAHKITQIKEHDPKVAQNMDNNVLSALESRKANANEIQSSEGSGLEDYDQGDYTSLQLVQAFIVSSRALKFLRHRVLRFVQPSVLQAISAEVQLGTKPDCLQETIFQIHWEFKKYCTEELEKDKNFPLLLTISGTAKSAYATTCGEYMERNWPKSGLETLRMLQAAISKEAYGKLDP